MREKERDMELILASGSPRRRELLSLYTTDFTVCVSDFDESTVTYMVDVDSTGLFGDTVCIILSGAAGLAVIYAVWELVRILMDKYGDNDGEITVEIFEEEPAEEAEAEPTEAPAEAAEAEEKPEDNNDA